MLRSGDHSALRQFNRILVRIRTVGLGLLGSTMMDNIEGPIFEIRPRGYRVFCFFDRSTDTFWLLNGFRKRTARTPPSEISRARELAAEITRGF